MIKTGVKELERWLDSQLTIAYNSSLRGNLTPLASIATHTHTSFKMTETNCKKKKKNTRLQVR